MPPILLPDGVVHGDVLDIAVADIVANEWNPNSMSAEQFRLLSEDISNPDRGYLQTITVGPYKREGGRIIWRIVDGEHRYHAARIADRETIKAIVVDPERMPEIEQKKQTVRMNVLRGKLDASKFVKLVNDVAENSGMTVEDMGVDFGFSDDAEFQRIISSARESLPDQDAKEEFDRIKTQIRTMDDLSGVLNSLFTKYGNTLNANYMVIDFGGKRHLWVRLKDNSGFDTLRRTARDVLDNGFTFDSFLLKLLSDIPVKEACENWADVLVRVADIQAEQERLDDLFAQDTEDET